MSQRYWDLAKLLIATIFLLDSTLPLVAKSNKTLQTEHLDLSNLSSLVYAITPAANWVLKLCEESANLETPTGTEIYCTKKTTFQETTAKPFIANLKDNISS